MSAYPFIGTFFVELLKKRSRKNGKRIVFIRDMGRTFSMDGCRGTNASDSLDKNGPAGIQYTEPLRWFRETIKDSGGSNADGLK